MTRFFLCAAALVIGATIAAAVPARAESLPTDTASTTASTDVSLIGLDLTTTHDQLQARDRISVAATHVCSSLAGAGFGSDLLACRDAAIDHAQLALAQKIEDAKLRQQVAFNQR